MSPRAMACAFEISFLKIGFVFAQCLIKRLRRLSGFEPRSRDCQFGSFGVMLSDPETAQIVGRLPEDT